jgi:hypothetical protein
VAWNSHDYFANQSYCSGLSGFFQDNRNKTTNSSGKCFALEKIQKIKKATKICQIPKNRLD